MRVGEADSTFVPSPSRAPLAKGHMRKESWMTHLRSLFASSTIDESSIAGRSSPCGGGSVRIEDLELPCRRVFESVGVETCDALYNKVHEWTSNYQEKAVETDGNLPLPLLRTVHIRDLSIDTNESDTTDNFSVDNNVEIRSISPMHCLPIYGVKQQSSTLSTTLELPAGQANQYHHHSPLRDQESRMPLAQARVPATPILKERRIRFNNFACLLDAALEGDIKEVCQLIEVEKIHPDTCNADGVTALHCAAGTSRLELVQYLIKQGANVNVADDHGWTPLHSAAYTNHLEITQLLVENGAGVETLDSQGQAPLGLPSDHGVIKFLGDIIRRKSTSEWVTALYDFDPKLLENPEGDELSFNKGDQLRIINRTDPDWWLAERQDCKGFIPRQFVQ